jgi:S-adenosylmethionine hydrolase
MPIITLLTDFGLSDSYVAEVKGVLFSQVPALTIVDVSHDVLPGDVQSASYLLSRVWRRYPEGTVHLAVVDPGVGSARRALAGTERGHFFVAPDNGILSFLSSDARFVALPIPPDASPTFHGRDVFAPAAAALALGKPLAECGSAVSAIERLRTAEPSARGGGWVGTVIYVDRFGTLVTNLRPEMLGPEARLAVAGRDAGAVRRTFSDAEPGSLVAFLGSGGTIEIAVRDGSAAATLGAGIGAEIRAG